MSDTLDDPRSTASALGAEATPDDALPPKPVKTALAPLNPNAQPREPQQPQKNPWDADPLFSGAYKIISPGEGAHGNPNAKNPYSSATGLTQITRPTFLSTFKKWHPDQAQGKSDDEIWALAKDGDTNTKVGAELAHDNATQMQKAGVQVTPNSIAAAHRIGSGGAIGALKADPNTPLSQVAPDVLTRGNEDIASLTVGQFLANPYPGRSGGGSGGSGAGGDPSALFRINQSAEEGNRMFADLNRNLSEDRERISRLAKDYKPFEATPPPKQPDVDPLQAFGSVASIFGLLAAGLSKTPAIAAMNALAGSIEGAAQHDWKKYQTEYRAWKDNTDYAIQAHKIYSEDVNEALRMMSTDATTGHAMLQLALTKSGDYENQMRAWRKDPLEFQELQSNAEKARLQMEKMREETDMHVQLKAANQNLDQNREALRLAQSTGDPEKISAAEQNYKQAQEIVDEKYSSIERLKRAEMGGFDPRRGAGSAVSQQQMELYRQQVRDHPEWGDEDKTRALNNILGREDPTDKAQRLKAADANKGTPQSVALRKYMDEHPDATAEDIQKFITNFKSDAPDVARRKDADLELRQKKEATYERSAQITQDYKERVLKLNTDKSISAQERATRLDEERARHDRALEDVMRSRLTKAPTAAASKERDAAILAESKFVQEEGRAPTDSDADQTKMAQLRTGARRESANEVISDEAADFTAGRVLAGDQHATVGMARSSANITKVTNHLVQMAKEQNISARELSVRIAEFMGTVAGERTLGVQAARMEVMAKQVEQFAPLVVERSHAVDRTEYPDLNSIQLAVEKRTGDTNVVLFSQALNSMAAEYAKFLNPQGIATDADKAKAREILDIAWTTGQIDATIKQIQMEIEFGQKSIGSVRKEFREGFGGVMGPAPGNDPPPDPEQFFSDVPKEVMDAAIADYKRKSAVGVPPAPTGGRSQPSSPPRVTNDAEYNAIPSGTEFVDPNGVKRRKP